MPDNVLLKSCPYGGIFVLCHSEYNQLVINFKQFMIRCCSVQINLNSLKCVFVCTRVSTNERRHTVNEELYHTLDEIKTFISSLDVDLILLVW